MISGSNPQASTSLRAGIEIRIEPGWHTYWRYPGDSGVPPRFDFSGSENLANVEVLYPAPHLYTDETGNTLGYKNSVTLPLRVKAKQAGKPVILRLKLDYAVCEKLCMPVEGKAELPISLGVSAQDANLKAAEARVPVQVTPKDIALSARRVNDGAKPLVVVDLNPPDGKPAQVFVEGPSPEWALPIPKRVPDAPHGRQQFAFRLDGLPPGTDPKGDFELTFTVIEGDQAYETKAHLD